MPKVNVFWLLLFVLIFHKSSAQDISHLNLPNGVIGPETIAFDCYGNGPYVGVSDGRILKWQNSTSSWEPFATTTANRSALCDGLEVVDSPDEAYCGRPLGLKFHPKTCDLYIADAYFGLLKVGPDGGVAKLLVNSAGGVPMRFTNALDIEPSTGMIYFTDSSTIYSRWQWRCVRETMDRTGRFISYDLHNGRVSVLLSGLAFANGVALSKNGRFVLVAETSTQQIHRFWLRGPKSQTSEIFVQLSGYPDNVERNSNGDFWIAQYPPHSSPDHVITPSSWDEGRPVKIDAFGRLLEVLNDFSGSTSGVTDFENTLWLGSVFNSYVEVRTYGYLAS